MEHSGMIEKKIEKEGKNGKFYTVIVNGELFNSFNEEFNDLEIGDYCKIDFESNGNFKNIIKVEKQGSSNIVEEQIETENKQKIKVISNSSFEDFELSVNEFMKSNNVFATQTHYQAYEGFQNYVAVLYYK